MILSEAKKAGFIIELVTDKDSSMNAIYCHHFPEGTIMYCSNHSAKTAQGSDVVTDFSAKQKAKVDIV